MYNVMGKIYVHAACKCEGYCFWRILFPFNCCHMFFFTFLHENYIYTVFLIIVIFYNTNDFLNSPKILVKEVPSGVPEEVN